MTSTFHDDAFWHELIFRGTESDVLDYKAHQDWTQLSKAGKAKFVRHCLALANTKGGYVVIGVGEDSSGRPCLYTGLTEKESSSFDPTTVGTFISRYADPPIELTVERPVVEGKRYAVLCVKRFASLPHVCSATCSEELVQGVFYIRTADASSRPAFRASELHDLILRSLRNQREQLSRMLRGILSGEHPEEDSAEEHASRFAEEFAHSLRFFRKYQPVPGSVIVSFSVTPSAWMDRRFSLTMLRTAAENTALQCVSGFFPPECVEKAYATNVSLRYVSEQQKKLFQLFRSGQFHIAWMEDTVFEKRILLLSDAEQFCRSAMTCIASLCAQLFDEGEQLRISLQVTGTEGLLMDSGDGGTHRCMIPDIDIRDSRPLNSGFVSGSTEYLLNSLCERFNVRITG